MLQCAPELQRNEPPIHILRVQIQRVQSTFVLLEGILARLQELHARAAELIAEQAKTDSPVTPRRGGQSACTASEGSYEVAKNSGIAENGAGGGGLFAPSLGVIDQAFLFAMVWGLGGGLTGDPALAFDVYVRDLVNVSPVRRCAYRGGNTTEYGQNNPL